MENAESDAEEATVDKKINAYDKLSTNILSRVVMTFFAICCKIVFRVIQQEEVLV